MATLVLFFYGGLLLAFVNAVLLLLLLFWRAIHFLEAFLIILAAYGILWATPRLYQAEGDNLFEDLYLGLNFSAGVFFFDRVLILVYLFWRMAKPKKEKKKLFLNRFEDASKSQHQPSNK